MSVKYLQKVYARAVFDTTAPLQLQLPLVEPYKCLLCLYLWHCTWMLTLYNLRTMLTSVLSSQPNSGYTLAVNVLLSNIIFFGCWQDWRESMKFFPLYSHWCNITDMSHSPMREKGVGSDAVDVHWYVSFTYAWKSRRFWRSWRSDRHCHTHLE